MYFTYFGILSSYENEVWRGGIEIRAKGMQQLRQWNRNYNNENYSTLTDMIPKKDDVRSRVNMHFEGRK